MRRLGRVVVTVGLGCGLLFGSAGWAVAYPLPLPKPQEKSSDSPISSHACRKGGGTVERVSSGSPYRRSSLECVDGKKDGRKVYSSRRGGRR